MCACVEEDTCEGVCVEEGVEGGVTVEEGVTVEGMVEAEGTIILQRLPGTGPEADQLGASQR